MQESETLCGRFSEVFTALTPGWTPGPGEIFIGCCEERRTGGWYRGSRRERNTTRAFKFFSAKKNIP